VLLLKNPFLENIMKKNIKAARERNLYLSKPEIEKLIHDEIKKSMEKSAKNWIL
jgi:hypothetical protein